MKNREGANILLMSSAAGYTLRETLGFYALSKLGVLGLTKVK